MSEKEKDESLVIDLKNDKFSWANDGDLVINLPDKKKEEKDKDKKE